MILSGRNDLLEYMITRSLEKKIFRKHANTLCVQLIFFCIPKNNLKSLYLLRLDTLYVTGINLRLRKRSKILKWVPDYLHIFLMVKKVKYRNKGEKNYFMCFTGLCSYENILL